MRSNISGIPYGRHAAVPMDPATRPEHFVVRQGKIRSTHEAFDEGKCLLYTEAGRYHFLIPTGKTDSDGDPVLEPMPSAGLTGPRRTRQRFISTASRSCMAIAIPSPSSSTISPTTTPLSPAGRNFADDPEKYRSYLEYMSRELHANWAQGRELGWRLGQQSGYQSKFEFPAAPTCAKRLAP